MTATNETKKRTRINVIHDVTWEMCAALPNVVTKENTQPVSAEMREILYNAALEHRSWRFDVDDNREFTIHASMDEDAEEIGEVQWQWSSRSGNYLPHLRGWRIGQNNRRQGVFSHKEVAPILRKMREHIYPKTDEEIMKQATGGVSSDLWSIVNVSEREASETKDRMRRAALAFALDPEFKEAFLKYEATIGVAKKRNTAADMEKHEDALAKQKLAETARSQAGKEMALMARLDKGWYIKHKEQMHKYADDELPTQYANVHALKLVQNNTVLAGLGVKLNDKTFVVVVNE